MSDSYRESNQEKEAKNIKSDNFTGSNKEKWNIAFVIWEKYQTI